MDIRFRVGQPGPVNDFARIGPPTLFDMDEHAREQEEIAGSALGSEFLVTLAHELRTPLTSLRASFDLLRDPGSQRAEGQNLKALLENMERGIARLERQVSDLLEAGYLRSGGIVLRMQPVELDALVGEAISEVSGAASWRKVAIDVSVDESVPVIRADPQRLLQVLVNLLSNAIKHSPAGGVVTLLAELNTPDEDAGDEASVDDRPTTRLDEPAGEGGAAGVVMRVPEVRVAVSDSGPGIGPELHRKVFLPFYRVRSESSDASAGAGLGLTIAHGLVRLHGGRMWIRSDRGAGAEIGFGIPVDGRS